MGTLLFGRKAYEGMAGYWSTQSGPVAEFMNRVPKVVFSRTLRNPEWTNSTLETGDAKAADAQLKEDSGKDMFVFGSPTLASALSEAGLVDEYRFGIAPVLLGRGRLLLAALRDPLKLHYLESRVLSSDVQLLRLEPDRISG